MKYVVRAENKSTLRRDILMISRCKEEAEQEMDDFNVGLIPAGTWELSVEEVDDDVDEESIYQDHIDSLNDDILDLRNQLLNAQRKIDKMEGKYPIAKGG